MDNDSDDGKAMRNYRPGRGGGSSAFDAPQGFTTSVLCQLPTGRNWNGLVRYLLGGWQVKEIPALQSGMPFDVTTSVGRSNTGVTFDSSPDRTCNGNLPASQRRSELWFYMDSFLLPAPNTYGNASVHYRDTDGIRNVDLAVFKNIGFIERLRLQLRGEAFNAFNFVGFRRSTSGLESPIFRRVGTALDGQIIQLGAKVVW